MRLTEVNIDRFGVWRDLNVPLNESGVNVFYGPNEAGKSTFMRFVRGVLYGFPPQSGRNGHATGSQTDAPGNAQGALHIIHEGREHIIRREARGGERGRAQFDELAWGTASEARIRQVVGDTSESLYENIFAIGLSELQELAVLDAEDVAQHIYGMSLGPEGERILRARSSFEKQRQRLLSDDRKAGELVRLASRLEELDRELAGLGDVSQKHQLLRAEKQRLLSEIESAQKRRSELTHQLRGCRFLDRVYAPWNRARQLQSERDSLSLPRDFPADGLTQLDQIEQDLKDQQAHRDRLMQESEQLDREADEAAIDTAFFQHECTIRRLSDHCDGLGYRQRRLHEKQSRADALQERLNAKLAACGSGWSAERLTQNRLPADGLSRLWEAARRFRAAVSQRRRTVQRYKTAVSVTQRRQAEFNERMKSLDGRSLSEAIREAERRLNDIRQLNSLRVEEMRLTAQAIAARGRVAIRSEMRELPHLFSLMMWFFAAAGLVLALLGLWGGWSNSVAGGSTAWIVGLIYFCFGLFMAGASWTVKQHLDQYFEPPPVPNPDPSAGSPAPQRADPRVGQNLACVQQAIRDIVGTASAPPQPRLMGVPDELAGHVRDRSHDESPDEQAEKLDESDVLLRMVQRLADLQALQREEQLIQQRRHRLSRYREILRDRQRLVSSRRREWCDTLRELGIGETLKTSEALRRWQAVGDAQHVGRALALMQDEVRAEQNAIEDRQRQIETLIGELPEEAVAGLDGDPDQIISRWRSRTHKRNDSQDERIRLRKLARDKRREAETTEQALRELNNRRSTLLLQAGVSSRDELAAQTQALSRHQELTRLLDEAQSELRTVAEAEPELAIVEEDLLAFDPAGNTQSIQQIEAELAQIDHGLQAAHEQLGRTKSELQELAADRRSVSLRFEREQIAADLARQTEAWCSLDLSIEAVDHIRHRLERYAQSETLQLASQYLDRLTCGKYPNVWSPLGERHLCIDDDAEQTLRIEQLSTGTREQLFLALRLAMIRRFADEGIELPMVLDDVFVNFDQIRTEAAVDTILDFADQGQQILLFTCHLHLAHMFEAKGVDPAWLPVNSAAVEKRRAG